MMSNRKAVRESDSAELVIMKRDVRRGLERMARPERSGGTPKVNARASMSMRVRVSGFEG